MLARQIAHIRICHLYTSAHQRQDETLRGQPIVVAQGQKIIEVSPEAAAVGLKPSLSALQVPRLCPKAVVVRYEEDRYRELYRLVWDVVAQYSPIVEPETFHRGYADLTGCLAPGERLSDFCHRLARGIRERAKLDSRIGGGPNKLLARLASRQGMGYVVEPGEEHFFLRTVPLGWVEDLSEGVRKRLFRLGLATLGDLASVPAESLAFQFGEEGKRLQLIAQGVDLEPVRPLYPPPYLQEERWFEVPEVNELRLQAHLLLACQRLWRRLAKEAKQAGGLEIALWPQRRAVGRGFPAKIGTVPGAPCPERKRSKRGWIVPNFRGPATSSVCSTTTKALNSESRLVHAALSLLRKVWQGEEVSGFRLRVTDLSPASGRQLALWNGNGNGNKEVHLAQAMEALRRRYGGRAIQRGVSDPRRPRMAELIREQQAALWS